VPSPGGVRQNGMPPRCALIRELLGGSALAANVLRPTSFPLGKPRSLALAALRLAQHVEGDKRLHADRVGGCALTG
jgi:hypothetical protein